MLRRLVCVLVLVSGVLGAGVLTPGAWAEGVCPNEALRSELGSGALPDCRAYEMVSPPYKASEPVLLEFVSSDGSRVLVSSTGAFAGAEGKGNLGLTSFYDISRTSSGWVTSSLDPPAPQFPIQKFVSASADLGRTLWAMRHPSQSIYAEDLYVREADGSLVKVGPTVPPADVAGPPAGLDQIFYNEVAAIGGSSDLSHVLFKTANGTMPWPGDTTVREGSSRSLYEYVGTGNRQPDLVGVDGAGRLISDCGTDLGSSRSEDTYNAMSADGEAVFFTARAATAGPEGKSCTSAGEGAGPRVDELYARLDQVQTVAISEPTPGQCQECRTEAKAPAVFQGASEDGSKVFFLTEQELLPGDSTQNLYEYDFDNPAGQKVVRVSGGSAAPEVQGVTRVSADGSHMYFVAKGVLTGQNAEHKEPVAGGANLYVFERDAAHPGGRLAFVATLQIAETEAERQQKNEACEALGEPERAACEEHVIQEFFRSQMDEQDWSTRDVHPAQATPDGRFLVFQTIADVTPGDTSSESQIFEYDALREALVRVSVGADGYAAGLASADAHGSSISGQTYTETVSRPSLQRDLAVLDDGSRVLFSSAGALTPGAEEAAATGGESLYEYRSAGPISNGGVYLISDGRNALSPLPAGMSASGDDVFFESEDPLLAQDVDTQRDFYDARVDGGFPAPPLLEACTGQACHGAPSSSPSFAAPGSASAQGGGNLLPAPPGPGIRPKAKSPTRAQKLASALRACRRGHGRRRTVCEARARRRYAVQKKSSGRGKGGR